MCFGRADLEQRVSRSPKWSCQVRKLVTATGAGLVYSGQRNTVWAIASAAPTGGFGPGVTRDIGCRLRIQIVPSKYILK